MPAKEEWFEEELKKVDPNLFVQWNDKKHRWEVRRKIKVMKDYGMVSGFGRLCMSKDTDTYIMDIKNSDGSFRPLDMRTIQKVRYGNIERFSNFNEMERELFLDPEYYRDRDEENKRYDLLESTKNDLKIHMFKRKSYYVGSKRSL